MQISRNSVNGLKSNN